MNHDWQPLLRRLTDRLGVDPELQMDVWQELRAHLEDSAAAFRRAGESDDQAAKQAVAALGDEQTLAEDLWQANRLRLRWRGVLRWTARVTLIPAAVAVVLLIGLGMKGLFPVDRAFFREEFGMLMITPPPGLTEEQRAVITSFNARDPHQAAKQLSDRWPDNPIYFGNYVAAFSSKHYQPPATAEQLEEWFVLCDRGIKVDPDNAYYNFLKAAFRIESAGQLQEDTTRTYSLTDRRGKVSQKKCWKAVIQDPKQFDLGVAELRRGLEKGEYSPRTFEMAKLRLSLLPTPDRLADILKRTGIEVSILLPSLNRYRNLNKALAARAVALAEAGREKEAIALIKTADALSAHFGAHAQTLIELLVAQAMRCNTLAHAEQVYKELGRDDLAQKAAQELEEQNRFMNDFWKQPNRTSTMLPQTGMLWSILVPSIPGYAESIHFEPIRTAEKFLACEFALLALLAAVVLLALLLGTITLWHLLTSKKDRRPVLVFVGWSEMGRICFWAVVCPIVAIGAYRYLAPGEYGLNVSHGRVLAEYVLTGTVIVVLLLGFGYSAIRRRAEELGLAVPPRSSRAYRIAMLCLGLLAAGGNVWYIAHWWLFPPSGTHIETNLAGGAVFAGITLLFLLIWLVSAVVHLYFRRDYRRFRRTLWRSLVPILAAAVIVIGMFAGWGLSRGERSAVRRATGPAAFSFQSEVERSEFHRLRERFRAQLQTLRETESADENITK